MRVREKGRDKEEERGTGATNITGLPRFELSEECRTWNSLCNSKESCTAKNLFLKCRLEKS